MKKLSGGVTAARGFTAAGIHCGIKKRPILDLALLWSERAGPIAGVFTTNRVVAAPVVLDQRHLRLGLGRAIIVNSGCANACTGSMGMRAAEDTAALAARHLRIPTHHVFVGSTGVIGTPLPVSRVRRGFPTLAARLRRAGADEAARAIMTTDTRPKQFAAQARIGGALVTVGGMAKGSGMIHPNMATMLAYVTTDAAILRAALQRALRHAADRTFNRISVDGDTSTNDTVLCLANGMAENRPIRIGAREYEAFIRLLTAVCESLALQVCRDGEGVTKLVEIRVRGAKSDEDARRIADTIATSCLVKTALFGEDANWGRILAAIGRAGVRVDPDRIALSIGDVPIVKRGVGLGPAAERRLAQVFRKKTFTIDSTVGRRSGQARMWTTDLSYDYVRINASYRS